MKTVFAVFERLEHFYDDNDKRLECLFEKYEDAEAHVKEIHYLNLFIEELKVY